MTTTQDLTSQDLVPQEAAREQFQKAYENRYTWDSNFPGFTATVTLAQDEHTCTGTVTVSKTWDVEVTGIEDDTMKESIYTQLRDVITHRKRNTFEASHGKHTFSFGKTDDSGAVEILVSGDAMGSNYKLRNNEVCQVSRVMGRMAFTIDHHESLNTGSGYVSTHYTAVFCNPKTNEVMREMEFHDTYEKVGDYYLMSQQTIHTVEQGQPKTTTFTFSNLALLA